MSKTISNKTIFEIMRMSFIQLFLITVMVNISYAHSGYGQVTLKEKVSLTVKNGSIKSLLQNIEKQVDVTFSYKKGIILSNEKINVEFKNETLEDVLNKVFSPRDISFQLIQENQIVLNRSQSLGNVLEGGNELFINSLNEQVADVIVKGIVSDDKGAPLAGVSIAVKGTNTGTITDANGEYTIKTTDNKAVLVFSFLGFTTQEIAVNGKTQINLSLKPESKSLDEVVVTALGISRKTKSLGYSVSEISGKKLVENKTLNLATQLSGKVAGLSVSTSSTGSNGSTRVKIRGNAGVGASAHPLYVVDGIPINLAQNNVSGTFGGVDYGDGLAAINPDDIESLSVLKGNAAAALYGFQASNGVILITTKSGKGKKFGVDFNTNNTFEEVVNFQDNIQESYGLGDNGLRPTTASEAFAWGLRSWGAKLDGQPTIGFDGVLRPYSFRRNPLDIFKTGFTTSNTVSLYGAGEDQNVRLSFGNTKSTSFVPNSSFDRTNVGINYNATFFKKLNISFNSKYSKVEDKNRPATGDFANSGLVGLTTTTSLDQIIGQLDRPGTGIDGKEYRFHPDDFWKNPYYAFYEEKNIQVQDRLINSIQAKLDITNWLYLKGTFGMDYLSSSIKFSEPILRHQNAALGGGFVSENFSDINQTNLDFIVGFNKNAGKFNFNGFAGGNQLRYKNNNLYNEGTNVKSPDLYTLNNTTNQRTLRSQTQTGVNSLYYSAEVNYDNYAFLSTTGRTDWFSTLNGTSVFYPSITGSLVFTDMFRKNDISFLNDVLDFGKLRMSWASVGGGAGSAYESNLAYGFGTGLHNGALIGSIAQGSIPASNLRPSLNEEFEVGFDLRFFDSRLTLDVAAYKKITTNEINSTTYSIASGYSGSLINIGRVDNKGIEVSLGFVPIRTQSFEWNSTINFAKNINEVKELDGVNTEQIVSSSRTGRAFIKNIIGQPIGTISTFLQDKINGQLVYDTNGRPVYAAKDTNYKPGVHDKLASWSNTFSYKGFVLSALLDGQFGGYINSGTETNLIGNGLSTQSLNGREAGQEIIINGVTTAGVPIVNRVITPNLLRGYYGRWANLNNTYDASFIKLREFSIGYDLKKVIKLKDIKALNFSIVGRNLFTLYKKTLNIDPEASVNNLASGLEYSGLPATRTLGFNISAKF